MSGTWSAPDGAGHTFGVATTVDWGVLRSVTDATGEVHIETGVPATVEIRRSLGRMFNGVEFDELHGDQLRDGHLPRARRDDRVRRDSG